VYVWGRGERGAGGVDGTVVHAVQLCRVGVVAGRR
jgi:hypothetical protein